MLIYVYESCNTEDTGRYGTRIVMKHISDVIAAEFIVIKRAIYICFPIIDADFSGYQEAADGLVVRAGTSVT